MPEDDLMTPWPKRAIESQYVPADPPRGGAEYARLHLAQRVVQARLAGAVLPPEVAHDVAGRLDELAALLDGYQVAEPDRVDGWRPDLPGRGHPLLPAFVIDDEDAASLRGHVTFTRFHLGGGNAVHGGVQPLLFDDVLGRVVNHGRSRIARTAYLKVDYRRVTPLDVELGFDASLDRLEGRKRYATGRLYGPDGAVLAEADALYVELLPGQP